MSVGALAMREQSLNIFHFAGYLQLKYSPLSIEGIQTLPVVVELAFTSHGPGVAFSSLSRISFNLSARVMVCLSLCLLTFDKSPRLLSVFQPQPQALSLELLAENVVA